MCVCLYIYTIALPSSSLQNISVTPLNSISFMITWRMSLLNYIYKVIWTNLNNDVMNSYTIQDNENSYIVTGLSDDANYNVSVAAVSICGNETIVPITVYGKYFGALL